MADPRSPSNLVLAGLGQAVRARRKQAGRTLEQLAAAAGLSSRYLSDVEAGRGNISVARLDALAKALGATAASLLAPAHARRVVLLGLRGAGKSTVGRLLADRLGAGFVELDQRIEEAAGLPLAEIFAVHGEAYYRRIERDEVRRLLAEPGPVVVAAGGGLVTDPETFALLAGGSTTVWLRATPQEHLARVEAQGDRRPMARSADALAELTAILAARTPLYARADHAVGTTGHAPAAVAERVAALVTSAR